MLLVRRHHHASLCCVVTRTARRRALVLNASMGGLLLVLKILRLAAVDAAVVHTVGYESVIWNRGLPCVGIQARLNACVALACGQADPCAHV